MNVSFVRDQDCGPEIMRVHRMSCCTRQLSSVLFCPTIYCHKRLGGRGFARSGRRAVARRHTCQIYCEQRDKPRRCLGCQGTTPVLPPSFQFPIFSPPGISGEMKEGTPNKKWSCVYFFIMAPFHGGVCILSRVYTFTPTATLVDVYTSPLYGGVCILSPCVYFFSSGYISGCVYFVPLYLVNMMVSVSARLVSVAA